jgi:hypothetical protein
MTFVSLTGYMNAGPFEFIAFTDYLSNSLLNPKLLNLCFDMSHFCFPLTGLGVGIFLADS